MTNDYEQLITDLKQPTWQPLSRSQVAEKYFGHGHAFDNNTFKQFKELALAQGVTDLDHKIYRTDYNLNSIATINFVPSAFDSTVTLLTEEQVEQLDNVLTNPPKRLFITENTNILRALASLTNYPIIAGSGFDVTGPLKQKLLDWCNRHNVIVHYLGDWDPIGLKIANNLTTYANTPTDELFVAYPSTEVQASLMLMRHGVVVADLPDKEKRFAINNFNGLTDKRLMHLKNAMTLTGTTRETMRVIEQETLVQHWYPKILATLA